MDEQVDVIINRNSLIRTERGNVLGEVFFNIDGKLFPEKGWSDYIVVIITWWIEEISRMGKANNIKDFKLNFMDGPLYVKGSFINEYKIQLGFMREKIDEDEIFFTSICNFNQLKNSINQEANVLIQEVDKRGWISEDINKLKSTISKEEFTVL